jgi:YggT family protein
MFNIIANGISFVANLFIIVVIADSVVSFFLKPYHPVRSILDRIVQPVLAPIRRIVPLVGMLDLSPLILIILVEILTRVLLSFILKL